MGRGEINNERKPVTTVTVGSVAIPIYAAPVTVRVESEENGATVNHTRPLRL